MSVIILGWGVRDKVLYGSYLNGFMSINAIHANYKLLKDGQNVVNI